MMLMVFLGAIAAAIAAQPTTGTVVDAATATQMARKACWETGGVTPYWRARLASGHLDASLTKNVWHIRLVEGSKAPACPIIEADVTADRGAITCTLTTCQPAA